MPISLRKKKVKTVEKAKSKGYRVCPSCQERISIMHKECPECGHEFEPSEWKLGIGEIQICDDPNTGLRFDTNRQMVIRIQNKAYSYHGSYAAVLRHLRQERIALKAQDAKTLQDIMKIEQDTLEVIKQAAKKLLVAEFNHE